VDAVINLAGANILDQRWTEERKKEIIDSRVDTTRSLVEAMQHMRNPPKVFIGSSAIGIYPLSTPLEYDEDYVVPEVSDNFAGQTCKVWEKASELPISLQKTTRRVVIRIGIVIGKDGGPTKAMIPLFRWGFGGCVGSGKQTMPWIHIDDIIALLEYAVEHDNVEGVLNGVAPQITSNEEFTYALAGALHRPAFFHVPAFVINYAFEERAFFVLEGVKVVPKRTLQSGFQFTYVTIDEALRQITSQ